MLTESEINQVVVEHGGNNRLFSWGQNRFCVYLGVNQVHFLVESQSLEIFGNVDSWENWLRFDETDLEFRGIPVVWWERHKPLIQLIAQAIELKMNSDALA